MSGAGSRSSLITPPVLLDLLLGDDDRLKIGNRRRGDEDVRLGHVPVNGRVHVAGALDVDARDARGRRQTAPGPITSVTCAPASRAAAATAKPIFPELRLVR